MTTTTYKETREKGKNIRWIFYQVCKTVLPYLIEEYSGETETLATKIITRFCYMRLGLDNLYEEHSARIGSGNFRDTLSESHIANIAEEELRLSKLLISLPYSMTAKVNRPTDLLNYLA